MMLPTHVPRGDSKRLNDRVRARTIENQFAISEAGTSAGGDALYR